VICVAADTFSGRLDQRAYGRVFFNVARLTIQKLPRAWSSAEPFFSLTTLDIAPAETRLNFSASRDERDIGRKILISLRRFRSREQLLRGVPTTAGSSVQCPPAPRQLAFHYGRKKQPSPFYVYLLSNAENPNEGIIRVDVELLRQARASYCSHQGVGGAAIQGGRLASQYGP
jgi:hypothetical protein